MKFYIENNKISAVVSDEHIGGELIDVPTDFNMDDIGKYSVADGALVIAIPQEVQMYQAREALIRSGIPTTQIDTIIAGLPSPQKELSQNQWEYSPTMKRYNSWVSELAPLIPLTETQLDDLFILAGTL